MAGVEARFSSGRKASTEDDHVALNIGQKAPGFRLSSGPGQDVDVGELIGSEKVLLLFFPLAFSPVCTAEMCQMAEDWRKWEEIGANVFGISVDSMYALQRFREDEKIPFPLLSDFNRTAARAYDVLYEDFYGMEGVAKRSAFVVDSSGSIAYSWSTDDASVQPDYDDVRAAVVAAL